MNINLIGVPLFYGSDIEGVEFGPKKLREKNIVEVLSKYHRVYDFGDLYVPEENSLNKYSYHPKMKYLKPIIQVNTNLAQEVYASLSSKSFPLILGGDHSLALGSISGVSKYYKNFAVIWVDAHGDINSYLTTHTGNVHGMPLAAAMGVGYNDLTNLYFHGTKVKPENVFIIGARDLDEGECELIEEKNLNVYSTEDIKYKGISYVMEDILSKLDAQGIDAIHLSFDIDCIDPDFVPGTGTPVKDGLSTGEAKTLLKSLGESRLIKSMDFVELNPRLDKDDSTSNLCIELLDWCFKYIK
ncbi:arginase [Clostridium tetani]|uniref:Arginase n=1 Tax=Clostridium tetani TaxID=1513 RepID=A0A4Q0VEN6_CLOTA|nr:arginase [Clostridium tetani]RXI49839.1 arginase [Clostridium tetani]BDR67544.1 arginase [Clostridium tetani]BDR72934.1 arginase [Clostridium tetani]BDR81477.1 arginase [Clostridium tetani]BDR89857.1 arginase [Clostridium tetani]